jgi:hypothetical protein
MKNLFAAVVACSLVASAPAFAADGLHIDFTIPVVHGGMALDVDTGVTVGVKLPIVGGGTEIGLLTPTDAISVKMTAPITDKSVNVGCCVAGVPYGKKD